MVVDMPFGSYEESSAQAFRGAAHMMAETGCVAVRLEGGETMAETIHFLSARGIPVMAQIRLTPQAVNTFGGFACRAGARAPSASCATPLLLPRRVLSRRARKVSVPAKGTIGTVTRRERLAGMAAARICAERGPVRCGDDESGALLS